MRIFRQLVDEIGAGQTIGSRTRAMARNIWKGRQAVAADKPDGDVGNISEETTDLFTTGGILRTRREALGINLRDVSNVLRIRYPYLEAIEGDRFVELPGFTYSVGFVRGYAAHLGLNADDLVVQFRRESDTAKGRPKLIFPVPSVEAQVPRKSVLLIAAFLAICVYGSWIYLSTQEYSLRNIIPGVQQRIAVLTGESSDNSLLTTDTKSPSKSSTETQKSSVSTTLTMVPAVTTSAEREIKEHASASGQTAKNDTGAVATVTDQVLLDHAKVTEPPAKATSPSTPALDKPPMSLARKPMVYGVVSKDIRIVIQANSDSWVEIKDIDNKLLLSRVLFAGDSFRVPNQPGLTMMTGNAGALLIKVDGEPVQSLGLRGSVLRDIRLEAEQLKKNTAHNP